MPDVTKNQGSTEIDTQYATTLICEALRELQRGRAGKCAAILEHALVLLPQVTARQQGIAERRAQRCGFDAAGGA